MSKDAFGKRSGGAIPPRKWRNADTLEAVKQMNEHFLRTLKSFAVRRPDKYPIEVIRRHRRLWQRSDASAMKCAAKSPVLLIDVRFGTEDWWKWAITHATGYWRGEQRAESFPSKTANRLMRATLMLAWHAAREGLNASQILFGMSTGVAALIAELTPQQIESIASRHSRELRVRWEEVPGYWQTLLSAAQSRDCARLRAVHLYGIQLIASELSAVQHPAL